MTGYRNAAIGLALITMALGVAILVRAIAEHGTVGIVIGVLFFCAGAARLWLARRRG